MLTQAGRPGSGSGGDTSERSQALGLLETPHALAVPKRDPALHPFNPSSEDVAQAELALRGLRALMHSANLKAISPDCRKALSAFNLGSSGFLLAPEMASQVLSCLEDETDLAGIVNSVTISGPSLKYLVDNERWDVSAWACEIRCFANNPTGNIGDGFGEIEIKPESLRYVACVSRDLLEDASINLESWLLQKTSTAFRAQISQAVLAGDGIGKPLGLLNGGIPVCDTGDFRLAGQFTWMDLVSLKYQLAPQHWPAPVT
jgi:HK97 family phage major capsid protein